MSKYNRTIITKEGNKGTVDVYRVLDAFNSGCPILDHISKKSLCAGLRGHKNRMQDLLDIKQSIEAAILLEEQKQDGTLADRIAEAIRTNDGLNAHSLAEKLDTSPEYIGEVYRQLLHKKIIKPVPYFYKKNKESSKTKAIKQSINAIREYCLNNNGDTLYALANNVDLNHHYVRKVIRTHLIDEGIFIVRGKIFLRDVHD